MIEMKEEVVAGEVGEAANMVTAEAAAIVRAVAVVKETLEVEVAVMIGEAEAEAGVVPEAGMIEIVAGEIGATEEMEEENAGKTQSLAGLL